MELSEEIPDDTLVKMSITIIRSSERFGPFTVEQANSMLASGQLMPSDFAICEGTGPWVPLMDVPGIVKFPPRPGTPAANASDKLILPAFLLAFMIGPLGIHRFYVGKTGSGIAMLVLSITLVGLVVSVVWSMVDWIMIVCGSFTDKDGRKLTQWT